MSKSQTRASVLGIVLAIGAFGFGFLSVMLGIGAAAEASRSLAVSRTSLARLSSEEPLTYVVVDGARLESAIELTRDYGACRTQPGRCWSQLVAVVPIDWAPGREVPAWMKCFQGCLGKPWSAAARAGTLPLTLHIGERREWPAADDGLVRDAERATGARSAARVSLLEPSEPPKRDRRVYALLAVFAVLSFAHAVGSLLCFRKAVR